MRLRLLATCGVLLVLASAVSTGCTEGRPTTRPRIVVTPAAALTDVSVRVQLSGLPSRTLVTVTSSATDHTGVVWKASAVYRSSAGGWLDLDQAPVSGDYSGSNPMGLFQFMKPPDTALDGDTELITAGDEFRITLTASADGKQLASTDLLQRLPWSKSLPHPISYRHYHRAVDGFEAHLFLPASTSTRRPAVLLFGDQAGGENLDETAGLLATHGYPAMSLAYLNLAGLPDQMVNLPLEYFTRALRVLRSAPGVDPNHVLVLSYGRGSEAALLLAAHFPDLLAGAIVGSASSVVNPAGYQDDQPAWLLDGKPLPHTSAAEFGMVDPPDAPQAVIPVERIRGPLLLACSDHDVLWNSCAHVDAITSRLAASGFGYSVSKLALPGGYYSNDPAPYHSTVDSDLKKGGGSAATDEPAEIDFYRKVLEFLGSISQ